MTILQRSRHLYATWTPRAGGLQPTRQSQSDKQQLAQAVHKYALAVSFVLACSPGWAFEFATHAALTREAYARSKLYAGDPPVPKASSVVSSLGLESRFSDLGNTYIDQLSGPTERSSTPPPYIDFASAKIDDANTASLIRPKLPQLPGWLMLGAIREDDGPYDPGEIENTPDDDPLGNFVRVRNHFFDPYFDRPLTIDGARLGASALRWANEGAPGKDGRSNSFSVTRAREAMWRALTLKEAPPTGANGVVLPDLAFNASAKLPTRESLRVAYWATTFRSLGDVLHLLQDMAQPQHTRNDAHAGAGCTGANCALGHKSYFEGYVDARVKRAQAFTLRERFFQTYGIRDVDEPIQARLPDFTGYPDVRLSSYDGYMTSGTAGASIEGKGLANYSNRGFFTAGTLPGHPAEPLERFPSPDPLALSPSSIAGENLVNASGGKVTKGALLLLRGSVTDKLHGGTSAADIALASYGAFDQFLRSKGKSGYVLTHYNYADQARLLIPRAVAYSAGLLDYFFRGMLEIGLPDEGVFAAIDSSAPVCKDTCGFGRVKLKLTNATPDEAVGPGVAVAVAKFHRNLCYRGDLSGEPGGPNFSSAACRNPEEEIVVSSAKTIASLPTGSTQTLSFDFAQRAIPINATDITLQVVYRGKLGNEDDAVVVTTRNIAEPNHLALENSTDYRFNAGTGTYALSGAPATFTGATVTFGSAAAPLATAAAIPAPGYAQVSFLADKAGTPVRIDFAAPNLAGGRPLTLTLPAFEFYLPAGTGATYASNWQVGMVRGAFRRFVYSVARSQNYEVYQCAPDFNPAACGEAMLSPLTAANAVPWVVTFQ